MAARITAPVVPGCLDMAIRLLITGIHPILVIGIALMRSGVGGGETETLPPGLLTVAAAQPVDLFAKAFNLFRCLVQHAAVLFPCRIYIFVASDLSAKLAVRRRYHP